ncbi:aspartate kinase [Westiellopsis prolifica IICB1]|nr:aspartate kinase [Westiellopsis prolifica IICB1]
MALIVQKYGGTSVGSVERILSVAARVCKTVKAGHSLVVVVSAMGKTTDQLAELANKISKNPSRREWDMLLSMGEQVSIALLSMALQELGQPAISLTGAQARIITEPKHTRARILHIQTECIERHLKEGKVVVVAGFQGITSINELEITTLGRGGSDTSAVALAAALKASFCEIYTDVPGILTTDPRLIPEAQLMDQITCDEMLEFASLGAKVMHPRAVEIARNYGVPLVVRSSMTDEPGTWIISPKPEPRPLNNLEISRTVDCVEYDTNFVKMMLRYIPDKPGIVAQLFSKIAYRNVDVDLITQSLLEGNTSDIAFTVKTPFLERVETEAEGIATAFRRKSNSKPTEAEVVVEQDIAKVSIVGAGMIGRPGIAAKMFATLAEIGIDIQMISTSEVKISCVIDAADCERAVAALCKAFEVNNFPASKHTYKYTFASGTSSASFSLPVRGVALDMNQARLIIRQVPDRLGIAAKLFELLAQRSISVDTIIQSQRYHWIDNIPKRDITFTVAQIDAEIAQKILQEAAAEFGWSEAVLDNAIAKISIVGTGMIKQPSVAARMFEALAQHQINILLIATSEIKISCVVAREQGITALQAIHAAFELADSQKIQVSACL